MKGSLCAIVIGLLSITSFAQKKPRPDGTAPAVDSNNNTENHVQKLSINLAPLLDAQAFLSAVEKKDAKLVIQYMYAYEGLDLANFNIDTLKKMVNENPFLPLLSKDLTWLTGIQEVAAIRSLSPSTGDKAVPTGGLNTIFPANRVADGIGTFIADRFKEELTRSYIKRFRDTLTTKDSKYHYSKLLPQTYKTLTLYESVFDYQSLMTALKEAFKTDIQNLDAGLIAFLEAHKKDSTIEMPAELLFAAKFYTINVKAGENPLTLFETPARFEYYNDLNNDTKVYLGRISFFLSALRNNTGELLSLAQAKNFDDPRLLPAFLCLVYLKSDDAKIQKFLKDTKDHADRVRKILQALVQTGDQIKKYGDASDRDLIMLVKNVNKNARTIFGELDSINGAKSSKAGVVFDRIDEFLALAASIQEEKYGLAITQSIGLMEKSSIDTKHPFFFKSYKKYGPFIANVAQANSSAEVKEALEVAALPVGSYQIKRQTFSEISLNAYAGLFAGLEYRTSPPKGANEIVGAVGFTAPAGLAFSWGTRDVVKTRQAGDKRVKTSWKPTGSSNSFFFSIIDVGAVTSFRIADDSTETLPEFTWENILAPGVFYVRGLKDSPVSLGIGVQSGPQLRELTSTSTVLSDANWTCKAFVAVDIPIFSFVSRTYRKRKVNSK